MKVDTSNKVYEAWVTDWYTCPNCNFDSLDISFRYCPSCGQMLQWDEEGDE